MEFLPLIGTIMVALITAVVGPSVTMYLKEKLFKKEDESTKDSMYREMEVDNEINETIEKLLKTLNCDRIWISQFHNGSYYYTSGVSIKKYSVFYEAVGPGIAKTQQLFQNVPTSFFSKTLYAIYEIGEVEIPDTTDDSMGYATISQETGSLSIFMFRLLNLKNHFHGVLSVEYVKHKHDFTKDEKDKIRAAGTYISGILSTIHK